MKTNYLFECGCGQTHTSPVPGTPPGWLIGRNGKPVCDDCAAAARDSRRKIAA